MLIYLFAMAKSCVWLELPFYHYVNEEKSESLTHRNFQTKEGWNRQIVNINCVTNYLLSIDKKGYNLTANYIKWLWKERFIGAFDNSWSFWRAYHECYRDILKFGLWDMETISPIKTWLTYNVYPLYWYRIGRYKFSQLPNISSRNRTNEYAVS